MNGFEQSAPLGRKLRNGFELQSEFPVSLLDIRSLKSHHSPSRDRKFPLAGGTEANSPAELWLLIQRRPVVILNSVSPFGKNGPFQKPRTMAAIAGGVLFWPFGKGNHFQLAMLAYNLSCKPQDDATALQHTTLATARGWALAVTLTTRRREFSSAS